MLPWAILYFSPLMGWKKKGMIWKELQLFLHYFGGLWAHRFSSKAVKGPEKIEMVKTVDVGRCCRAHGVSKRLYHIPNSKSHCMNDV
ncbi:hypothetical protein SDJN02_07586, partial [Cucurbita argyrosperma subsp. argyrosperma]